MRRRILFVTNQDRFFRTYRLPLALAEAERGAEVFAAAPEGEEGDAIREAGVPLFHIPLSRRGVVPWEELRSVRALASLYRRLQPDLVHHVTIKPVLYGSVAARRAGVPAVLNAVSGLGYVFTRGLRARLLRLAAERGYRSALNGRNVRTVFENPDDRDAFIERDLVSTERTSIIPGLGVDLSRFKRAPQPGGVPVVLLAGRLLEDKGIPEFVAAARAVRAAGIAARFCLVGEPDPGNPRSVDGDHLDRLHKSGIVEWWGQREDMPAVLASAAIVTLPTRYREGVPRVLLEGAASGRPLIASDMPGCREVVRDGQTGRLVPAGDAEALASAVAELLADAQLRERMGDAARRLVEEEFSQTVAIQRFLDLHASLMRGLEGARSGAELALCADRSATATAG